MSAILTAFSVIIACIAGWLDEYQLQKPWHDVWNSASGLRLNKTCPLCPAPLDRLC